MKWTWALGLSLMVSCAAPRVANLPELSSSLRSFSQHGQESGGHQSGGHHDNHIALFGGILRKHHGGSKDQASAVGLEFEHRFHDLWGAGFIAEIGGYPFNSSINAVALYVHPIDHVTLVVAPGVETESGHTKFMTRVGASYGFDVGEGVTVAPGIFYDLVENAHDGLVFGVSFGVGF